MAKLPSIKRISREDVKEAPGWIERILSPNNSFMESVYSALNKGLTFQENIQSQIKELTFQTTSDYGTAPEVDHWTPMSFSSTLKVRATGVLILQIYEKTSNYVPIVKPVSLSWMDLNGTINIDYIAGLEPSKTYLVRFLVI